MKTKAGLIRAWSYGQDVSTECECSDSETVFSTLGYCTSLAHRWHSLLLWLRYLIAVPITALTSAPGHLEPSDQLPGPEELGLIMAMQVSGDVHTSGGMINSFRADAVTPFALCRFHPACAVLIIPPTPDSNAPKYLWLPLRRHLGMEKKRFQNSSKLWYFYKGRSNTLK